MYIAEKILSEKYKIDMKKSNILKKYAKESSLTEEVILSVLEDEKPLETKGVKKVKIAKNIYNRFFTEQTKETEINAVIEKALEMYYASNKEKSYDIN